jgi:methionine-rich copper-binding protein CopC
MTPMSMKSRVRVLLIAVALFVHPLPVEAHAEPDRTDPTAGSTVSSSPKDVALYFTEEIEPKFSGAEIRNAAGTRVDTGADVSGKAMHLSIGALAPGTYSVSWHVTSVDTHKTHGSFSFTVGK